MERKKTKWYQESEKTKNNEKVIKVLQQGVKRFNEIVDTCNMSPTTIARILGELTRDRLAKKVIHENKEAYVLTDRGNIYYQKEIWHLINALEEMRDKGGGYLSTGRITDWGLWYHQAMDKPKREDEHVKIPYPFTPPITDADAGQFDELFSKEIISDIKRQKLSFDRPIKDKVIFAFEINYEDLTAFFGRVQKFMKDVIEEKDVFSNDELGFNTTSKSIRNIQFNKYRRYASKFEDVPFEKMLLKQKDRYTRYGVRI